MKTSNINLMIVSIIICIGGYVIVANYTNWQTSLGIFLIQWASNIEHRLKSTSRIKDTGKEKI